MSNVSRSLFDDSPVHKRFMGKLYSPSAAFCTAGIRLCRVLASTVVLPSLPALLFESGCQITAERTYSSYNSNAYWVEHDAPDLEPKWHPLLPYLRHRCIARLSKVSYCDCCSSYGCCMKSLVKYKQVEGSANCLQLLGLKDRLIGGIQRSLSV